jgi:hypothetical protein
MGRPAPTESSSASVALRWALGIVATAAALAAPLPGVSGAAEAFTLLTTDTGAPRVWRKAQLEYRTIYDVAPPEPAASEGAELGGRLDVAMVPWSDVQCSVKGKKVGVGVAFKMTAPGEVARCDDANDPLSKCAGGDGVIRVVADEAAWPHSKLTVGYTLLASDSASGESSRFVLLLNDGTYDFCDTSCDGNAFDIRTVTLHEAGHVLGLDHSSSSAAVMADGRSAGEILHVLSDDDIAGLCTIYPSDAGGAGDDGGGLCSAGRGSRPQSTAALLLLALGALLVARARPASASARVGGVGAGVGVAGVGLAVALLAAPLPAQAFTLATTSKGAHQRWGVAEVVWDLDETGLGAQGLDKDDIEPAAAAAFASWEAVACALCHDPDGVSCPPVACASHPLGVRFVFAGWQPPRPPGLGCASAENGSPCAGTPDGNQVLFVHEASAWLAGAHVVALTLVAADQRSGVIGDADILLNAANKQFCVAPACDKGRYDLQNTLTHEVGHLLGLDHSLDGGATMYGGSPPGETSKRELAEDDRLGVCTAYRTIWTAEGCVPVEADPPGCCATRPGGGDATAAIVLLAGVVAIGLARGAAA